MTGESIRIGISRCLLGEPVRYDGGHKRNDLIVADLGLHVEWIPICPEVEAGLGVPREPMQLVQVASTTRLVTVTTKRDRTRQLASFSTRRVRELKALSLSGYLFKARSPSCGIHAVPLYNQAGTANPEGMGLFAKAVRKAFPLIPITDEDHLANPVARKLFLSQVREYHQKLLMKTSHARRTVKPRPKTTYARQRRQHS
jgi:uncharacterized protein YbbK (DUF523 family)